jgi:hypothetical protein
MKLKIVDGWRPMGPLNIGGGKFYHCPGGMSGTGFFAGPRVEALKIERVELVTVEQKKSFAGSAALGLAGGLVLGVPGAVAGALAGGNSTEVCFHVEFEHGRSFTAMADEETYRRFAVAAACSGD